MAHLLLIVHYLQYIGEQWDKSRDIAGWKYFRIFPDTCRMQSIYEKYF